jgi:hypothetical protein
MEKAVVQARTAQASGAATCTVMACVPFDMQDGAGGHGAGKQRRYVHGKIAGAGGHGAGKQRRYMHGKIAH